MRADRLLSILLLIQLHGRLTTRELAKRLGVSERTIHRDMDALSISGIPIVAQRGATGGWEMAEEYQTNLTGLKPAEAQALALTPNRILADLGLDKASDSAFIKLLATLPSLGRRDAEYIHQRVYVDVSSWQPYDEPTPFLAIIREAIWQDHKLHLTYKRNDGNLVDRLVDPLGLVVKINSWYLAAVVESEIRTYRISRVQNASIADESFIRPENFDLAAYWKKSQTDFKANLNRYTATARVSSDTATRLRYVCRNARIELIESHSSMVAKGWQKIELRYEIESECAEALLALGACLEILDPPSLRNKVIALATEVISLYKQQGSE